MRWGDYIKRTAVRRVVWIVVGLVVYAALSWLGVARAEIAGCVQTSSTNFRCDTAPQAQSAAESYPENHDAYCPPHAPAQYGVFHYPSEKRFTKRYNCGAPPSGPSSGNGIGSASYDALCPAGGGVWFEDLGSCETACSEREAMSGPLTWETGGSDFAEPCVNGCGYTGLYVCAGPRCGMGRSSSLRPTGAQCSVGPTPSPISRDPDGVCSAIGNRGAQHCVSSPRDGTPPTHCIVHASGLSQCWEGGETGPRVNRSGTEGASREEQPAMPAPHPDQEGAKPEGSSTAHTRDGQGSGGSFNVIEFSGTGNSSDESDNGSGPGQGSAPGWGDTIGDGPGNTDGEGDGDEDGPGKPGPGLPDDFYQGESRTVSEVYNDFRDRVSDAPVVNFVDGFFTTPQGGSCPTFTLPASTYWEAMVFDYHCNEPLNQVLIMMGWLVLALAGYRAFHIAVG